MAAITVEDCLKVIPNRFELVLIASHRAKALMNGAPATYVSEKVEKNTVVALREVGANLLDINYIKNEIRANIKDQNLFKNYKEDLSSEDDKKDDDSSVNDDLLNDLGDDLSLDDSGEFNENNDDEEYYDNLGDDLEDVSLDGDDNIE